MPTPGLLPPLPPDAQTAVAIATATGARPYQDSTGAWATAPPGTVPPTVAVPRPPRPTPTPAPPIQCQFSDGASVTLQPDAAVPLSQGANATNSIVAGEPIPGISLDLRLDRTIFVAGGLIEPQILVHNTTGMDATIDGGASADVPGQPPRTDPSQLDPRWWPALRGRHFPGGRRLASGESLALSSIVQLPFDATQPVELHASVRVGLPTMTPLGSGRRVDADVPLQLTAPTPDQELTLELQTDRHQWCLRASTARGAAPTEPLAVALVLHGPRFYGESAPLAEDGGVYAGRWGLEGEVTMSNGVVIDRPADDPFTVSAWAGGPDYVTAVTQGAVPASP